MVGHDRVRDPLSQTASGIYSSLGLGAVTPQNMAHGACAAQFAALHHLVP